jgi:hypothetical protein
VKTLAVSFIVPCYKLAHLLPECVNSILSQSYGDFEILIMDDVSPDNTPAVANSFQDARVKHIRNKTNLGHLANYNEGIRLSQGKYVWLISADDRLRSTRVLERYIRVMDANPRIGYAFCPGISMLDGQETGLLAYSSQGFEDKIVKGHDFAAKLLKFNCVLAAAGMVRRECYEKVSYFPLDMPYAGDWYLWTVFALHYDVAYFAEPMVNYRLHSGSMTVQLNRRTRFCDELAVIMRVKEMIDAGEVPWLMKECRAAVAKVYIDELVVRLTPGVERGITLEEIGESLGRSPMNMVEQAEVQSLVFADLADRSYWQGDFAQAETYYAKAALGAGFISRIWLKRALLRTGSLGLRLRRLGSGIRNRVRGIARALPLS